MIDLYTFPTANGLRASIALEESGLPYRPHRVDISKGETKQPAFLKINPAGQIPVIVDDAGPSGKPLTLTQSNAILVYVADKSGKLLPADPLKRLRVLERHAWVMTDVASANNGVVQSIRFIKEKHQPSIDYFTDKLMGEFKAADTLLAGGGFLVGDFSIADVSFYPIYARAKTIVPRPEAFAALTNLARWADAMAARPGVERGMKVGA